MDEKLERLKSMGLLRQVVGAVPTRPRIGLMCWAARENTKSSNVLLAQIALWLAEGQSGRCFVLIEDVLPRVMFDRDLEAQQAVNQRYIDAFTAWGMGYCQLASAVYQARPALLADLAHLLNRITWQEFLSLLPQQKRAGVEAGSLDLGLFEVFHAGLHLLLLEELSRTADCWLTLMHSYAIGMAHRRLSAVPAAIIFVDQLRPEVVLSLNEDQAALSRPTWPAAHGATPKSAGEPGGGRLASAEEHA